MRWKRLLEDDGAVSPVIGVILMVAVTVVLAAVIATFVLGLGEQVSDAAPNTSIEFSYDDEVDSGVEDSWGENSNGEALLTITHTGGNNVDASLLGVTGSSAEPDGATYTDFSTSEESWNSSQMTAGASVSLWIDADDSVSVVWENDEGTDSARLRTFDGPDA